MSSEDVRASVQFLKWQDAYAQERPFMTFREIPLHAKDQRKTNLVFENAEVEIKDMRSIQHSFDLDTHGFMVTQLPPFIGDLDTDTICALYLPAVERLLKSKVEGADRVHIFDWRVRRGDEGAHSETIDIQDLSAPLKPANSVHIDTSPMGAIHRLQAELGAELAAEAFKSRVRIINVWRPVHHTVEDWPLMLGDGSTVDPTAFVETDVVVAKHVRSNLFGTYRNSYRWYYLPHQAPEEVLIFKQFDTKQNVQAKYCPHTSFLSPHAKPGAPSRRSIEVRAIVLNDP